MPEFLHLKSVDSALEVFFEQFEWEPRSELVKVVDGLDRVTVSKFTAPHPLPNFPRSTVDGFVVQSRDTHGASASAPAYMKIVGEILMGEGTEITLERGWSATIHTGGMLPQNVDAVVMLENTQIIRPGEIEITQAVAVGENVIAIGDDVVKGEQVLNAGTRLRPADIGGLMALGFTEIEVAEKPMIGILSTGDEVVPPSIELAPGQVRDVNSYSLGALVQSSGGIPVRYGIIPDRLEDLRVTAEKAMSECDMIIVTAGSSAGERDLTAQVLDSLGEPGVLVHGVNIRPGKPTILANCKGKAAVGLPGNPVSALVIASIFVVPIIKTLLGLPVDEPKPSFRAQLTTNLSSKSGREDWIPVRLVKTKEGFAADPVFGGSNMIFTLSRADGMVRIPANAAGVVAGEKVEVYFLLDYAR